MRITILQIHSLTKRGKKKHRLIINPLIVTEDHLGESLIGPREKFITSDEQVLNLPGYDSSLDGVIFVPEERRGQ